MPAATVTSKGQITIPKEIRGALGLEAGHRVSFRVREDGVVEMSAEKLDVMSLCGALKPSVQGVTLKDMEEAILQKGDRLVEEEPEKSLKPIPKFESEEEE